MMGKRNRNKNKSNRIPKMTPKTGTLRGDFVQDIIEGLGAQKKVQPAETDYESDTSSELFSTESNSPLDPVMSATGSICYADVARMAQQAIEAAQSSRLDSGGSARIVPSLSSFRPISVPSSSFATSTRIDTGGSARIVPSLLSLSPISPPSPPFVQLDSAAAMPAVEQSASFGYAAVAKMAQEAIEASTSILHASRSLINSPMGAASIDYAAEAPQTPVPTDASSYGAEMAFEAIYADDGNSMERALPICTDSPTGLAFDVSEEEKKLMEMPFYGQAEYRDDEYEMQQMQSQPDKEIQRRQQLQSEWSNLINNTAPNVVDEGFDWKDYYRRHLTDLNDPFDLFLPKDVHEMIEENGGNPNLIDPEKRCVLYSDTQLSVPRTPPPLGGTAPNGEYKSPWDDFLRRLGYID